MQIAITLPDEEVDELDRLVPSEFRSRSEAVRAAVSTWIAQRRSRDIDARYERAYVDLPQAHDDVDSGRADHRSTAHPWDELEW